jgi:hypothetical protein
LSEQDTQRGQGNNPPSAPPKPAGLGGAFLGAVVGAAGTAIVGLVFSSATISFLEKLFARNPFPKDAIVFTSASECGSGWKKYEQAQGRFIVAAGESPDGGPKFQAGFTGVGKSKITIGQDNLPPLTLNLKWQVTNIDIHGKGYDVPLKIGEGQATAPIPLGGKGAPIDTLPSWVSLTACKQD